MKFKGNYHRNKPELSHQVISSLSDMVPSLEYLSIEVKDIKGQMKIKLPNLKKLKINNCWSESNKPLFDVICPELECLDISGNPRIYCKLQMLLNRA